MEIKRIVVMLSFLLSLFQGYAQDAPKGKLIYCSYACERHAGQGKSYCELIADVGTTPQIVVSLYNDCFYREAVKKTFDVTDQDVEKLQMLLAKLKVYQLNGYKHDEALDGGATYRIYQEYATGEKINAVWSGHKIKPEAKAAYYRIEQFFEPWRQQVEVKD